MAQHDYVIANQSGSSFRSDLNNALSAIVSNNSGATAPSTTFAYQTWADTTAGVMKLRNAANSAWITLYELDGTYTIEAGTAAAPGLYFRGDTNTGIYSPGVDSFAIATGGSQRATVDSSGRFLVGTASASGQALAEVNGNFQHGGIVYSSASKSWSTAAAAALFDVKMNTGHCAAILNWTMTDASFANGARTGTLTIAVRGSGTTKSAVVIAQVDGAAVTSGSLSTLTWSAAIVSNEVQLTATPSVDSGTATVYLWGSSPFFTSDGIVAL